MGGLEVLSWDMKEDVNQGEKKILKEEESLLRDQKGKSYGSFDVKCLVLPQFDSA